MTTRRWLFSQMWLLASCLCAGQTTVRRAADAGTWERLPCVASKELTGRLLRWADADRIGLFKIESGQIASVEEQKDGLDIKYARLLLSGFLPAHRMDSINVRKECFFLIQSSANEPNARCGFAGDFYMYRPSVLRPGVLLLTVFSPASKEDVDRSLTVFSKMFPRGSEIEEIVSTSEKETSFVVQSVLDHIFKLDEACVFSVDMTTEKRRRGPGEPIALSRHEASELLYVLLGGEKYAERRKAATWLIPAEEMAELSTELGKSLQFYKTHEDERKKLFEEVGLMKDHREAR